jgi:hypothetical protein
MANTSDTIIVASCSSAGVMYSTLLGETRIATVIMSSLPTHGGPVLVQSNNGERIEVLANPAWGQQRLCIVGPYESVVLMGSTDVNDGTTAVVQKPQGGGDAAELECFGYYVADRAIGDISCAFTDDAADTSIAASISTLLTSWTSHTTDFLAGDSTQAAFNATVLSTNIANEISTMANHATSGFVFQFNESASSAMVMLNLLMDAVQDVGLQTST